MSNVETITRALTSFIEEAVERAVPDSDDFIGESDVETMIQDAFDSTDLVTEDDLESQVESAVESALDNAVNYAVENYVSNYDVVTRSDLDDAVLSIARDQLESLPRDPDSRCGLGVAFADAVHKVVGDVDIDALNARVRALETTLGSFLTVVNDAAASLPTPPIEWRADQYEVR